MITAAQIRLLKTGQRACGLDDETWRELLYQEAGVRSSKDLDNAGADRVLRRLEAAGFNNTARRSRPRPRPQPGGLITPPQQALIARNYDAMGYTGFAQRAGFNRRCCGKQLPQTRTDGRKVIEGQKAVLARNSKAVENPEL
ncbi:MAG: regulatory protein GemA [Acidobacteria bacterium]|nr:regulatory protein GemA [Acidobacteriota bacterium]